MFDDFESRRITLITAPVNMRLGYDMINVCLDQGTFERIMSRTEGPACHSLTKSELKTLISGERLFMHRTKLLDK